MRFTYTAMNALNVSLFFLFFFLVVFFLPAYGQPDWEPLFSSPEGSFNIVDFVVDEQGVIYALSLDRGIFRSLDRGSTWQPYNEGLRRPALTGIVRTPGGNLIVSGVGGVSLLRAGDSVWSSMNGNLSDSGIATGIRMLPNGVLLTAFVDSVGSKGGIYRSTDGGKIWRSVFNGDSTAQATDPDSETGSSFALVVRSDSRAQFARSPDGTLLAGLSDYLLRSVDNGRTWKPVWEGLPPTFIQSCLAASPVPGVFVTAVEPCGRIDPWNSFEGIYRTTDGGLTWSPLSAIKWDSTHTPMRMTSIHYHSDSTLYATAYHGLYRSDDSGATWSPVFTTPEDQPHLAGVQGVGFLNGGFLIAAENSLIRTPADGSSWVSVDKGLGGAVLYALTALDEQRLIGVGEGRVFATTNGGKSWESIAPFGRGTQNCNGYSYLQTAPNGSVFLFNGYDHGEPTSLLRSDDKGRTWKSLPLDSLCTSFRVASDGSLLAKVFVPDRIASSYSFLRSVDNGESWKEMASRTQQQVFSSRILYDACDSVILIADDTYHILRSADYGRSWHEVSDLQRPQMYTSYLVSVPSLHIGKDGTTLLLMDDSLAYSTDYGRTWGMKSPDQIRELPVTLLVEGDGLYMGERMRDLVRTRDNGTVWEPIGKEPDNSYITAMTATPAGTFFICTLQGNIYKTVGK